MEHKLKEILTSEEYVVKRNAVFAVNETLKTEREVDGNLVLSDIENNIKESETHIENLKKELKKEELKLSKNLSLKNEIKEAYVKTPKRLPNGLTETDENGEFIYTWIKRS